MEKINHYLSYQFAGGLTRALALLLALCLIPATMFSVKLLSNEVANWLFALILPVLVWLLFSYRKALIEIPERIYLIGLVLIFVVSRAAWIFIMPTLPISDYAFYYNIAARVAILRPFTDIPWRAINLNAYGYPVFLGLWFKVTSQSLLSAKLFSLFLGAGSLMMFFRISGYFGPDIGRIAPLLFTLWPAQLLYSSVLGSEHLGIFTLLFAVWHLFKALDPEDRNKWSGIIAGLFFGLTYLTRTALSVVLLWGLICVLLSAVDLKKKIFQIATILAAFVAIIGLFYVAIRLVFGVLPISNSLITLLMGTNYESIGFYNSADAEEYFKFDTVEEANAYAWQVAKVRIVDNPVKFIGLMMRKTPWMWSNDGFGYGFSTKKLSSTPHFASTEFGKAALEMTPLYFRTLALALSLLGCARIAVKRYVNQHNLFVIGAILSGVALHAVLETQPRYQMPYTPFLLILAAIGFAALIDFTEKSAHPDVERDELAG